MSVHGQYTVILSKGEVIVRKLARIDKYVLD